MMDTFYLTTDDILLGTQQQQQEEEDRFSLLPDCLLLEIISRLNLSTKEVIKTTSLICKRWQHLWTQLPTLTFVIRDDYPNYPGPADYCRIYKNDTFLSNYYTHLAHYFSFIDNTLTQCPTDMNLTKFKLRIVYDSQVCAHSKSRLFTWIRHAITRNVQEVDLFIYDESFRYPESFSYDDELFFNNSCLVSMSLSSCVLSPPNGVIRWDKLKYLRIDNGRLDEDVMGKISSGSPCLETLELNFCKFDGFSRKSLFGNFGVERLNCEMKTYELFANGDERFCDKQFGMKLSRCVFNPRNANGNAWGNLSFLCILCYKKLDEGSIGKILSGIPCLESLELKHCYGVRRIYVASTSVKNLVIIDYVDDPGYIDTLEIDAPNILSLTIKGSIDLEKIVLLNISSLVKAVFDYKSSFLYDRNHGRIKEEKDMEEKLLKGLLANLGHVNEITLENACLEAFSRLKKKSFSEARSTSRKENILNSSHSHRFYLLIIILLFSFWVAMVSNLFGRFIYLGLNRPPHMLKPCKALPFKF